MREADVGGLTSHAPIRTPKTAELISRAIRRNIVTGQLKFGDALPSEAELIQQFGVSRPTLREALRILESEALIKIHRGARGGARVLEPSNEIAAKYLGAYLQYLQTPLSDVHRAVTAIEVEAVARLAEGFSASNLAVLEELITEGDDAVGDPARYFRVDARFHRLLVDLAGNETLAAICLLLEYIDMVTVRVILQTSSDEITEGTLRRIQGVHPADSATPPGWSRGSCGVAVATVPRVSQPLSEPGRWGRGDDRSRLSPRTFEKG